MLTQRIFAVIICLAPGAGVVLAQSRPAAGAVSPVPTFSAPVVPAPTAMTPTSAAAAAASAPPAVADQRIRVQFSAQRQTVLSAEIAAKLITLPLREGDSFRVGQTLASFDCSIPRAQLSKAQATADGADKTLKVNRRLADLNSISTLEVDQSDAKFKEAESEIHALRAMLAKCSIAAPFAGRVAKLHVDNHQFVAQGKPLVEIVGVDQMELKLIVPSRWLAWLKKGTKFTVHVEELDRDVAAVVTRIGARIDPINQTVSLIAEASDKPDSLLPGMSGWASFSPPTKK